MTHTYWCCTDGILLIDNFVWLCCRWHQPAALNLNPNLLKSKCAITFSTKLFLVHIILSQNSKVWFEHNVLFKLTGSLQLARVDKWSGNNQQGSQWGSEAWWQGKGQRQVRSGSEKQWGNKCWKFWQSDREWKECSCGEQVEAVALIRGCGCRVEVSTAEEQADIMSRWEQWHIWAKPRVFIIEGKTDTDSYQYYIIEVISADIIGHPNTPIYIHILYICIHIYIFVQPKLKSFCFFFYHSTVAFLATHCHSGPSQSRTLASKITKSHVITYWWRHQWFSTLCALWYKTDAFSLRTLVQINTDFSF